MPPDFFAEMPEARARRKKIRYEKKSSVPLWIHVFGFVFEHHPDHIDQLAAQADQGLGFGFALGHFSLEVLPRRIIP